MGSWEKEGEASEETPALADVAEQLVDAEAEEEQEAGEVSFGFGDGYDFGARKAGVAEGFRKGVPDEA